MENQWSAQSIRQLRQQLGWTQAEFSRRMGVTVAQIQKWEDGSESPEEESLNQFLALQSHLTNYSESLSMDPLAEVYLSENSLNQVTRNNLKNGLDN